MERQTKEVEVLEFNECDGEAREWPLAQFVDALHKALHEIPQEHQGTATVKLRAVGEYSMACFDVTYTRPESDDELDARRGEEAARSAERAERERREYERLKAKFAP